jgi:outer membrane protein assembly factor BamB
MSYRQTAFALTLAVVPLVQSARAANAEPAPEAPRMRGIDANSGVVFGMRWRKPLVRQGMDRRVYDSFGTPGISLRNDLVIVGQGEGAVLALDLKDGHERWRYQHTSPFETSIAVIPWSSSTPELAIAVGRDGAVLALETSTGELRWRAEVGNDCRSPIRVAAQVLVLSTVANKVFAIELPTGKILWQNGRPAPSALTVQGHSAPTVSGDVVYAAFADGYVEAYRLSDGERIWSRPLSFKGADFGDADADPIVDGARLYVASYSDGVYCLQASDGQTVWQQPANAVVGLGFDAASPNSALVATSADGHILGLSRSDGRVTFRTQLGRAAPLTRPIVRDRLILLAAGSHGLIVQAARSGRPLQATAVPGQLASDPVWTGDWAAAISSDGFLYLFSLGDPGMIR